MWNEHHTMHFGKKFDPWESHNTMHFGKKSDSFENQNKNDFENKEQYENSNTVENIDKKFDWDSHNTMHFGKRDPEDYRNSFLFDKRDSWDYHNTMHFGKRDPWDYHNTMHFGKRNPWDYHNTMHFGKRDPWDYHNTMHFGKRTPWDNHSTMHFGKRSDPEMKDGSNSLTDDNVDQKEVKISTVENAKLGSAANNKVSSIRKRASVDTKSNEESNVKKLTTDTPVHESGIPSFLSPGEVIKNPQESSRSALEPKVKEKNTKLSLTERALAEDHSKNPQTSDKRSHIQKRSVKSTSFVKNINEDYDANIDLANKYSKDDIDDSVLHFGKRSIAVPDDYEEQWPEGEINKRFDDEFWNDHNTLHFGKRSDLWDNHNTLHFGKKSNSPEAYSIRTNMKRDPWEHLSTLHFGKKFDPWDGHAKMHFGKRTDNWDHNVMHFGKRNGLTPDELQFLSSLEDVDLLKLKDYAQSQNSEEEDSVETNDFLDNLAILKSIINSHLKDDTVPFEERVNLLRRYLKPILKAIIDNGGLEFNSVSEPQVDVNEHLNDYTKGEEDVFRESRFVPFKTINGIKYDEAILKNGNDDSSYGEYGDNPKNFKGDAENFAKSKRKYVGKAELKRYFVPFQGPKSIVYPHAWFASQIRRSSLPRTTDYARHMEMRMAEKKEDPFNSYMHFGRR